MVEEEEQPAGDRERRAGAGEDEAGVAPRLVGRDVIGVAGEPVAVEAALAPLYAWLHQLAQRADPRATMAGGSISSKAWVALAGDGAKRKRIRRALLGAGYATGVATLNRLGLGPLERDLSGPALRRGGLRGMREVTRRLGGAGAVLLG